MTLAIQILNGTVYPVLAERDLKHHPTQLFGKSDGHNDQVAT